MDCRLGDDLVVATPKCESRGVTIHLITGSDPRLVSDKVTEITRELIKAMDSQESRSTILETHDAGAPSSDLRENAIRQAIASAETMSLFGEERVVVIREIAEATVNELAILVKYLDQPADSTHLVVSATGKLPKSISDAFKLSGTTVISTEPPARRQELVTWFLEKFAESELSVDAVALNNIIDWLGEDQARLPGLIDTLVSAYGTSKKLTAQDVAVFLGDAGGVKPWDLTDAVDAGDSKLALEMLRRMLRSGDFHPLQVMAILHTHYLKLMRIDGPEIHSAADVLTLIGGKSEFQAKKYLTQYRRIGTSGISQAVQLLGRADVDLRGGKDLGEELTMEILVARLCRVGGATKLSSSKRTFSPKRN